MTEFITSEQLRKISKESVNIDEEGERRVRADIEHYCNMIKDKVKSQSFKQEVKETLLNTAKERKTECKVTLVWINPDKLDFRYSYFNLFDCSKPIGMFSSTVNKETIEKITCIDDLEEKFHPGYEDDKYYSKKNKEWIDLAYIIAHSLNKEDYYVGEDISVEYKLTYYYWGEICLEFNW